MDFVIPQLSSVSLCEFGHARACEKENIVPHCGGKPELKRRRRRRRRQIDSEVLLDVEITISADVNGSATWTEGNFLAGFKFHQ